MLSLKKIRFLKVNLPLIIGIFAVLVASVPLFKSGFFSHQDNLHLIRIYEMRKCIDDLQIPCRWSSDMAWGYGQPLFNFYSNFPYYLGALFSYIIGFLMAIKTLFLLSSILSFISMYLLVKEVFGKQAALLSSVLYTLAPYRALDLYVRGAIAESYAIAIMPLIFYFIYKIFKSRKVKYSLGLALSLFILLTSHNISSLIIFPCLFLWLLLLIFIFKGRYILAMIYSFLLGLGLSSYYIIPAFIEKKYINTEGLLSGSLDFRVHYLAFSQLLDKSWKYGASVYGINDGMSFQVGYPHLLFALASFLLLIMAIYKAYKRKDIKLILTNNYLQALFFLLVFLFSIFLTHNKSTFIWEGISIMQFIQFPWRFLILSIFSASILAGWIISIIKDNRYRKAVLYLSVFLGITLNYSYFRPEKYFALSNVEITRPEYLEEMSKGAMLDYLLFGALPPRSKAGGVEFKNAEGKFTTNEIRSNSFSYNLEVKRKGNVIVTQYAYPGWRITVNGEKTKEQISEGGLISLDLKEGSYIVKGIFRNNLIKFTGNTVTLLSALVLFIYYKHANKKIK